MPKFRFIGDQPVSIPRYGVSVKQGDTLDLSDTDAVGLAANPLFERIGGAPSGEVLEDLPAAIPSSDH